MSDNLHIDPDKRENYETTSIGPHYTSIELLDLVAFAFSIHQPVLYETMVERPYPWQILIQPMSEEDSDPFFIYTELSLTGAPVRLRNDTTRHFNCEVCGKCLLQTWNGHHDELDCPYVAFKLVAICEHPFRVVDGVLTNTLK